MANTGAAPAKSVESWPPQLPGHEVRAGQQRGLSATGTRATACSGAWRSCRRADAGGVELVVMPVEPRYRPKFVTAARNADGLSDQIASTIEVEGLAAHVLRGGRR